LKQGLLFVGRATVSDSSFSGLKINNNNNNKLKMKEIKMKNGSHSRMSNREIQDSIQ
jgi:hypothetical protein